MQDKTFNIIISGVGGQGVITLLSLIDEAAFTEGYDVKSSELHGLSQRGGAVEVHVKFGRKILSPLVSSGSVDLVISLEMLEGLRQLAKAGKNAKFLINEYYLPFQGAFTKLEIENHLKNIGENLRIVPASEICREKLQNEVVSTIYLLGYAVNKKLIPLKKESVLKAIENVVPEKYRQLNINALELAFNI